MTPPKFVVIGNPIEHSLSPEIHLAFGADVGIHLSYEKLYAETDKFESAAQAFFTNGGIGMNVTAPFKQDAFAFSAECDAAAIAAGAVNTIHAENDAFFGYNTDGIGLVRDLERLGWDLEDSRTLILGAGGAAQGVIQPLLEAGASLTVANRTYSRAETLQKRFSAISIVAFDKLDGGWDIVIDATAAGWQRERLPLATWIFEDARCYDLGYSRDGQTPFVSQVESTAAEVSDGLGMLVEQAAEAFRIWHGVVPQRAPVLAGLRNPKRQFIAGAECPRCHKEDTIYVEQDLLGAPKLRGCHECDFSEDMQGNVSINILK